MDLPASKSQRTSHISPAGSQGPGDTSQWEPPLEYPPASPSHRPTTGVLSQPGRVELPVKGSDTGARTFWGPHCSPVPPFGVQARSQFWGLQEPTGSCLLSGQNELQDGPIHKVSQKSSKRAPPIIQPASTPTVAPPRVWEGGRCLQTRLGRSAARQQGTQHDRGHLTVEWLRPRTRNMGTGPRGQPPPNTLVGCSPGGGLVGGALKGLQSRGEGR